MGINKTRIGPDRIGPDRTGLTKPGPDVIRLTKPGSDPKKSDRHKFPAKYLREIADRKCKTGENPKVFSLRPSATVFHHLLVYGAKATQLETEVKKAGCRSKVTAPRNQTVLVLFQK